jgi:hypothetical protein
VPALARTVGGLAEQFAGSPWTFPPRSPASLAGTLRRFLAAGPARRHARPGDSPASARRPDDLASVAASTLDLYQAVTAGQHGKVSHVA